MVITMKVDTIIRVANEVLPPQLKGYIDAIVQEIGGWEKIAEMISNDMITELCILIERAYYNIRDRFEDKASIRRAALSLINNIYMIAIRARELENNLSQ